MREGMRPFTTVADFGEPSEDVAVLCGFANWEDLVTEVERRQLIDSGDIDGLRTLLERRPDLVTRELTGWCDHQCPPLSYVCMIAFRHHRPQVQNPHTGAMAQLLLDRGAQIEGDGGETPLITAASYGDVDVARVLIANGAELETTGEAIAGGTALSHAVGFGMFEVADLLLAAGARIPSIVEAAGLGDISGWPSASESDLIKAVRLAATHERVGVLAELLGRGTPVDGVDENGSSALHEASYSGRSDAVRLLLAKRADPQLRDVRFGSTPRGWAEHRVEEVGPSPEHAAVLALLPTD